MTGVPWSSPELFLLGLYRNDSLKGSKLWLGFGCCWCGTEGGGGGGEKQSCVFNNNWQISSAACAGGSQNRNELISFNRETIQSPIISKQEWKKVTTGRKPYEESPMSSNVFNNLCWYEDTYNLLLLLLSLLLLLLLLLLLIIIILINILLLLLLIIIIIKKKMSQDKIWMQMIHCDICTFLLIKLLIYY